MRMPFTAILIGFLASTAGFSREDGSLAKAGHDEEMTTESFPVTFTPCSYWRYDSDLGGYYCSNTDFRVQVPEMRDFEALERLVDSLERRVAALERRIEDFEGRH